VSYARKIRWAALIAVLALLMPAIGWDLHTQIDTTGEDTAPYSVAAVSSAPQLAERAVRYALDNGISLLALATTGFTLLVSRPRCGHAPAQEPRQVGGLLARLTRPLPTLAGDDMAQAEYCLAVRRGGPAREHPLAQLNTFVGANPGLVDIVLDDEYVSG